MNAIDDSASLQAEFEKLIQNIAVEVSRSTVEQALERKHGALTSQQRGLLGKHQQLLERHTGDLAQSTKALNGTNTSLEQSVGQLAEMVAHNRQANADTQQVLGALREAIIETQAWTPVFAKLDAVAELHGRLLRTMFVLHGLTLCAVVGVLVVLLVR